MTILILPLVLGYKKNDLNRIYSNKPSCIKKE